MRLYASFFYKYLKILRKMDINEIRNIQLAYNSVYENLAESVDIEEGVKPIPRERMMLQAMRIAGQIPSADEEGKKTLMNRVEKIARVGDRHTPQKVIRKSNRNKTKGFYARVRKEEVDFSEIITSYLMEEGYVNNLQSAEVVMENMSELWINEIMEDYKKLPVYRMTRRAAKKAWRASEADTEAERNRLTKQGEKIAKVAGEHNPNKVGIMALSKIFKYNRENTKYPIDLSKR